MLRLIQDIETIALQAEINANLPDDCLPPPIPNEARKNWLSGIAIAKGDMTEERKNIHAKSNEAISRFQEKAWGRLPANTIVGDMRITPNQPAAGLPYLPNYRFIYARFDSQCEGCESDIERGQLILWYPSRKTVYCSNCDEFRACNVERMSNGMSDVRSWGNS